jgi:hypothetical protein
VHATAMGGGDSEAGSMRRWGGHVEGLRRRRGDAAGVELGGSLVERMVVNVGSALVPPYPQASSLVEGRPVVG